MKLNYFVYRQESIEENLLITASLNDAIEFMNDLFMEIHMNNDQDVVKIKLVDDQGEEILEYKMHLEVVANG